jgi:hypothetical protein
MAQSVHEALTSCVILRRGEIREGGMMMAGLDRDQLDALRRQVEEDYRLDIAAIERFQRRFAGANTNSPPATSTATAPTGATVSEIRGASMPIPEPVGQAEPDELTGTLRTMFSTYRR